MEHRETTIDDTAAAVHAQAEVAHGQEVAEQGGGLLQGLRVWNPSSLLQQRVVRRRLWIAAEFLLIILWALMFTRPYLNLDPLQIPSGNATRNEYLAHLADYHFWNRMQTCGWCAFWNDTMRGGSPTFANPFPSLLHPVVVVPVLLMGVEKGIKLAMVGGFIMGGLAQWWLAYVLGLGRVARLWVALMAVVAGHMAGRMQLGGFEMVISVAACTLVLPPLIVVSRTGSRRMAVVLGVVLALAALSGQGYMQIGLLLTAPAILLLFPNDLKHIIRVVRRLALAGLLAFLFAAPFLVPFLHFLPNFGKATDEEFKWGQPLNYVVLNLVNNNYEFYLNEELSKIPFPFLYVIYIGWIPLLLALWGLRRGRNPRERRSLVYLPVIALITLWVAASDGLLKAAADYAPEGLAEQIIGIRNYPIISALAVPPLLALAAIGVDKIVRARPLRFELTKGNERDAPLLFSFDLRWLLIIPLLLALIKAWAFTSNWVYTEELDTDVYAVLEELQTPDSQWINPPYMIYKYTGPAVAMGLKIANIEHAWLWKDRPVPLPVIEANPFAEPPDATVKTRVNDIPIYINPPGREYAAITHADESRTVCEGYGIGGDIDVFCDAPEPGVLTVRENWWKGWHVTIDGEPASLKPHEEGEQWLQVPVPAGEHTIRLRYRPWDVKIGLGLLVVGILLAGYSWWDGLRQRMK
jgi:hypothetical protein